MDNFLHLDRYTNPFFWLARDDKESESFWKIKLRVMS